MSHELSISNWGPAAWQFLHTVSYTYQKEPSLDDKHDMYMFLTYFAKVLPCKKCKDDFTDYVNTTLTKNSNHLDSRKNLSMYINDAHNYVNKKTGKREWSYDESREKFLNPKTDNAYILILFLILILFMTIAMRKKNNK
tara:strand:+ start:1672 stop:2088 length:417 start_codon:yes stop_codon:yes gene_type:complete